MTRTRSEIVAEIGRVITSIEELFADTEHWNQTNPDEPIDSDPDGELRQLHESLKAALTQEGVSIEVTGWHGDVLEIVKVSSKAELAKVLNTWLDHEGVASVTITKASSAILGDT